MGSVWAIDVVIVARIDEVIQLFSVVNTVFYEHQ